jgi:hypothetical protein
MALTLDGDGTIGGLSAFQQGAGLTLIAVQPFTAASSVSINDCFDSTYDNYLVIISGLTAAGSGVTNVRMRVSGVDATGANYDRYGFLVNGASISHNVLASQTSFLLMENSTDANGRSELYLSMPASAVKTRLSVRSYNGGTMYQWDGFHSPTTAYDGFTLTSTTTITGTVRVYGYTNGA